MDYSRDETHFVRCLKCLKILKCSRYDTTTLLEHIRTDHPEIEIVESNSHSHNSGSPLVAMKIPHAHLDNGVSDPLTEGMPGRSDTRTLGGADTNINSDKTMQMIVRAEKDYSDTFPEIKTCIDQDPSARNGTKDGPGKEEAKMLYSRRSKVAALPSKTSTPRKLSKYRTSIEKWRPAHGTIYCPKCGTNKRPLIKTRTERMSQDSCSVACLLSCWPFCFLPYLCSTEEKEYLHCSQCKTFLGLYDRSSNCVRPNRDLVGSQETIHPDTTPAIKR